MLFAQVGMGIVIPWQVALAFWCGGCGAVLAAGAALHALARQSRPALDLGLGIGACLMSPLAIGLWLWSDFPRPRAIWMSVVPFISLATGLWALFRGTRALR